MSGLCLGFLQLNKFPAKLFMGDTGSLSIGAILGTISILTNSFITIFISQEYSLPNLYQLSCSKF